ncbi:hypothetical protein COR50_18915 [Chitinophaga caeni]|uniref:Beta-lactamase-inhibitor-like PepSY-like domain-containing protein n=1 Tax=Chitinophaga caeni TaxID=2029983 RepID=A0A291QYZ9_9BACT|nr:PepSY-like domain-containing protein [Chitinophaga caeni]ATL49074.1 hypothetical protein COR50_18915 [Chitinophaga caeni]
MKSLKFILQIAFILLFATDYTMAQDSKTMLKAERIKSDQLPPEVIDAYKKKYPNANLKQIVKIPLNVYKEDWQIDELEHPDGSEQFYKLYLTGTNMHLEALYDAEGNLVRANEVAKNVKMPKKIGDYVYNNYKSYHVKSDKVKRLIEPNAINAEWEILVVKGKEKKRLLFDTDGNFVKEK